MGNRKYPLSLFVIGFITNVLFHFFWLFIPCIILLVIGIFVEPCRLIGLTLLLLDIVLSLIDQLRIRHTFLQDSDNPGFTAFQDALSRDGSWYENMSELLNKRTSDIQNEVSSDSESENE